MVLAQLKTKYLSDYHSEPFVSSAGVLLGSNSYDAAVYYNNKCGIFLNNVQDPSLVYAWICSRLSKN